MKPFTTTTTTNTTNTNITTSEPYFEVLRFFF